MFSKNSIVFSLFAGCFKAPQVHWEPPIYFFNMRKTKRNHSIFSSPHNSLFIDLFLILHELHAFQTKAIWFIYSVLALRLFAGKYPYYTLPSCNYSDPTVCFWEGNTKNCSIQDASIPLIYTKVWCFLFCFGVVPSP